MKLTSLKRGLEDLKEKTWKLDTNTRNNLVFYGIKEDGTCCNAEFAVKEVNSKIDLLTLFDCSDLEWKPCRKYQFVPTRPE